MAASPPTGLTSSHSLPMPSSTTSAPEHRRPELYNLCCRHRPGHRSLADVYPKVAIINRVYAAGLSRSFKAPSGGAEMAVTDGLIRLADLIEQSLKDLAGRQFDRQSAARVVELHGKVAKGLLPYTDNTWQQSFVSKYLHFHCDIIPIYDSYADHAISGRSSVEARRCGRSGPRCQARPPAHWPTAALWRPSSSYGSGLAPRLRSEPASRKPITCSGATPDHPSTERRLCSQRGFDWRAVHDALLVLRLSDGCDERDCIATVGRYEIHISAVIIARSISGAGQAVGRQPGLAKGDGVIKCLEAAEQASQRWRGWSGGCRASFGSVCLVVAAGATSVFRAGWFTVPLQRSSK